MLLTGQPMIDPPNIARVTESIDQGMHHGHCGVERESREIDLGGKNLVVASVEVYQNARSRVHDHEMVEGAEETTGRHRRELLKPLQNEHLVIADVDATDEDAETIYNEGRVKVAQFWD